MTNRPTNEFGGGKTGFAHLLAAGRYSLAGARDLAKESAARHEVLAFAAGLAVLLMCDARFSDYLVLSILFLILMSIEALNTSIEHIIDFLSPDKSEFARAAKDIGSLAVFLNLCAGGAYLLAVLARTFGWIEW
jgi:diacylglycerol kinase (ATP)